MKNRLDDLSFEELNTLYTMLSWFNKNPKPLRKEILNKIKEKIKKKELIE